ncbi:hypothetical protein LCM08_06245 [Salipiger pacificus]|nr:hypothetical protein [Alloyangia pacifica]
MSGERLFLELEVTPRGEFFPRVVDQDGRVAATMQSIRRVKLSIAQVEFEDGTTWPKPFDPEEEEPGFGA